MGRMLIERVTLGAITLVLLCVIFSNGTRAQDADAATQGRDLYEEFCGACHGYDGVSLLPGAPSFSSGERLERTDAELIKSILEGKGDIMPPWQGVLSDDECEEILHYVRSMIDQSELDENEAD